MSEANTNLSNHDGKTPGKSTTQAGGHTYRVEEHPDDVRDPKVSTEHSYKFVQKTKDDKKMDRAMPKDGPKGDQQSFLTHEQLAKANMHNKANESAIRQLTEDKDEFGPAYNYGEPDKKPDIRPAEMELESQKEPHSSPKYTSAHCPLDCIDGREEYDTHSNMHHHTNLQSDQFSHDLKLHPENMSSHQYYYQAMADGGKPHQDVSNNQFIDDRQEAHLTGLSLNQPHFRQTP